MTCSPAINRGVWSAARSPLCGRRAALEWAWSASGAPRLGRRWGGLPAFPPHSKGHGSRTAHWIHERRSEQGTERPSPAGGRGRNRSARFQATRQGCQTVAGGGVPAARDDTAGGVDMGVHPAGVPEASPPPGSCVLRPLSGSAALSRPVRRSAISGNALASLRDGGRTPFPIRHSPLHRTIDNWRLHA